MTHHNLIRSQCNNCCRALGSVRDYYAKDFAITATKFNDLLGNRTISARTVNDHIQTIHVTYRKKRITNGRDVFGIN